MVRMQLSRRRFLQGVSWLSAGTLVAACTVPMPTPAGMDGRCGG